MIVSNRAHRVQVCIVSTQHADCYRAQNKTKFQNKTARLITNCRCLVTGMTELTNSPIANESYNSMKSAVDS